MKNGKQQQNENERQNRRQKIPKRRHSMEEIQMPSGGDLGKEKEDGEFRNMGLWTLSSFIAGRGPSERLDLTVAKPKVIAFHVVQGLYRHYDVPGA